MKTLHTIVREDFGLLDRNLVRSELLREPGVREVSFETLRNALSVVYDPAAIDDSRLIEIMCQYNVFPEPVAPRRNGHRGASTGTPAES